MPPIVALLVGFADMSAEMLVLRAGRFALGASAASTALLLALVLAGLGIGAALATRLHGARTFAVLRGLAGLLSAVGAVGVIRLGGIPGAGANDLAPAVAIAAALAFAIPAGASLPLLYPWARGSARRAGVLVAANALGGAAGAFVGAVVVPARLGSLAGALALLAALLLAAALALGASRILAERAPAAAAPRFAAPRSDAQDSGARPRVALLLAAGAGTATIAFEALFARLLPFFLDERSDALAVLLVASLVGISAGAAAAAALLRAVPVRTLAGAAVGLLSFAGPASLLVLEGLSRIPWIPLPRTEGEFLSARVLVGAALVLPPLFAAGFASPVAFAWARGPDRHRAARLHVAYALGALAPIALIPSFLGAGVSTTTLLGSAGACMLPVAIALRGAGAVAFLVPILSGALLGAGALPERVPPFRTKPWLRVLEAREGPVGLAAAVRDARQHETILFTNGFRAAATGDDYRYTRSLGHLPILYCGREPRSAAVLAVGTGSTGAAVLRHGEIRSVDLVEISGDVLELTPHFAPASDALYDVDAPAPGERRLDPRVRPTIADGRRFLAGSADRYDVIALEPLLPDTPSAYPFYTRQFHELARQRLAEGGVLAHWVPIHSTEPRAFRAIVATFAQAFPHRALFVVGASALLLGSDAPLRLRQAQLQAALLDPVLAADLRRSGCASAGDLVAQCALGDGGLAAFVTTHPLGDDAATIERLRFLPEAEFRRYESENLQAILQAREAAAGDVLPGMEALAPGERDARAAAGAAYLRARKAAVEAVGTVMGGVATTDPASSAALSDATAHPFAALDGRRFAWWRDSFEGRRQLDRSEIQLALAPLERAARGTRDPLVLLALAKALQASSRTEDAAVAAATALALHPASPTLLAREWREFAGKEEDPDLVAAVAAGAALLPRLPPEPRTLEEVARALASREPLQRVVAATTLARRREALALAVEERAATVVARSVEEAEAALEVALALEDPTLAEARRRLEAASAAR